MTMNSDKPPDDFTLVWGAAAIGREIGRTPRQSFYLLEKGFIPSAQKIGTQWVASRQGLHKTFVGNGGAADPEVGGE